MIQRQDSAALIRMQFAISQDRKDVIDAVTEMTMAIRQAEGMAQACLSAMHDDQMWEHDLQNALELLSTYLVGLRQGMERWYDEMDMAQPTSDEDA
jgi:hypothetical protein